MRAGFDCEVAAGFLASGRTLANVANAVAIVTGFAYWYEGPGWSSDALALSMIAWVTQSLFAARVAIDHSLFQTLAKDPGTAGGWLDALLVDWKLVSAGKSPSMPERSLSDRVRGALRLWRIQRAALVLQLAALGVAMILRAVNL